MGIFKALILTAALSSTCILMASAEDAKAPGGKALLAEDDELIKMLEEKRKESGNSEEIDELIKLAQAMKRANDQQHQIHVASRQLHDNFKKIVEASDNFAKAMDLFSEQDKKVIEAVNHVLKDLADSVIKNQKILDAVQGDDNGGSNKKRKRTDGSG